MRMTGIGDDATLAFVSVARQYRAAVDERDPGDAAAFLRAIQPLLPALCHAALSLPRLDEIHLPHDGDDDANRDEAGSFVDAWRPLCEALTRELDPHAHYWQVFDPYGSADPVEASLSDDLTDIYIDLDRGLRRWDDAGDAVRRAIVWEWRFSYESHWGRHAIGAMGAIHALLYVHL
jgi:hypothetical protein